MSKKEKIMVKPKILELQQSNDIYMTITMCILTNQVNLNNARFTDDFINGVVENKEKYIGIPLVANRVKLENGVYNSLTHEFDSSTGELKTDIIGSFSDFWTSTDEDGSLLLMGNARVFKRYPNVCSALIELYESGDLEFSCEVLVTQYEDIQDGVRTIGYADGANQLIGSAVVTYPAEPKSKAYLLVAEALEKDFGDSGGDKMSKQHKTEVFNKGHEISYHGKELSSLTFEEIGNQIYNLLNPIDAKTGNREYNYWIRDLYNDYVIVEDWDDYNDLWKIPYQISNNTVILAPQDQWVRGSLGFIPDGVDIDSLMSDLESQTVEMNNKINELNTQHKEELEKMDEQHKAQIEELQSKIGQLTAKVDELNNLVVSQKEEIVQLQEKEKELNSVIEELKPYKDKVEQAELEEKQKALEEKFSKLLSEETFKSEEVQNAIKELNETKLNEIVVAEVAKEKISAPKKENVIVTASAQADLIPQSRKDRLYTPKSE
jgi:hypothetical protein